MINSIAALKAACPIKQIEVNIGDTEEKIVLRELTVADRGEHSRLAKEKPDDYLYLACFLVARSCPDLSDNDIDELLTLGAKHIETLSLEVCKISGLLPDSIEDAAKN